MPLVIAAASVRLLLRPRVQPPPPGHHFGSQFCDLWICLLVVLVSSLCVCASILTTIFTDVISILQANYNLQQATQRCHHSQLPHIVHPNNPWRARGGSAALLQVPLISQLRHATALLRSTGQFQCFSAHPNDGQQHLCDVSDMILQLTADICALGAMKAGHARSCALACTPTWVPLTYRITHATPLEFLTLVCTCGV